MLNAEQILLLDLKVERANKHIRELQSEIQDFHRQNPYAVIEKQDHETGEGVLVLRVQQSIPPVLSVIVGDVVHNLRTALDHLFWQLLLADGVRPTKRAAFPISDDMAAFESICTRKIKAISNDAVSILKALKPYKGGNDALWCLHQLSIVDKHRLLITIDSVRGAIRMGGVEFDLRAFAQRRGRRALLDPLKDGAELFRGSLVRIIDDGEEMKPYFSFDIAFGEPEILKGEPVIPFLHQLASHIQSVIQRFRA